MNKLSTYAVLAAGVLTLSACSGTGQEEPAADEDVQDLTIAVVTHGAPDDSFWSVVKAGSDQAGEDLGIDVEYNSDPDATAQSELIDQAVADEVNGIVVSMANPDGLRDSVEAAVQAGVPVITINSGVEESAEFGAITHIGQSEDIAGEAAGEKFNELGATKLLCVIHEAGNIGLEQRCEGAAKTFGGEVENIDAVLALNGQVALGSTQAVEELGTEVQTGTFDLSSDVISAIQDGQLSFAVDQQPYVQGYLGVQFLYLKAINGNDVGGGQPVYSGPALVTEENADAVAEFTEAGTR
jgi:simple sugar transport system substrate-binding protein